MVVCLTVALRSLDAEGPDLAPRFDLSPDGSSRPTPGSAARTFALALGALILFVPANVFPTLTVTARGSTQTATVFGGVLDLWQAGMWPLAIIVVFASLLIPFFKIIGLMFLTLTLDRPADPHARTRLYLVIAQIGRWSMLDVYVISLLVAVLHFGALAQAKADIGSLAFVSVVIVTLLAARSFDPRLIWQHQTSRPAAGSEPAQGSMRPWPNPARRPRPLLPRRPCARAGACTCSYVWLVPIIAAAVGGYLFYRTEIDVGPTIEIDFADGTHISRGLQSGLSRRQVGSVQSVELDAGLQHVNVVVQLHKPAAGLAREGSQFWIVEPRISVGQVTGLDTLLSGSYIEVAPGSGAATTQFRRPRQSAGAEPRREADMVVFLEAEDAASLETGSPILLPGHRRRQGRRPRSAAGRLAGPARGRDRAPSMPRWCGPTRCSGAPAACISTCSRWTPRSTSARSRA